MKHCFFWFLMALGTVGVAQNSISMPSSELDSMYAPRRYNELGLNAIGILQQLPFVNGGEVAFNNVAMLWRFHWAGDRGNLRVGVGGRISSNSNILNLRIGRDRLRSLNSHWQYLRGWEWFLSATGGDSNAQATGGYSWINGLRYDLNDRISFATEGNLTIGLTSAPNSAFGTSFDVRLIPLGSLYICYRLFP